MRAELFHKPVLVEEVLEGLNLKKGGVYLDATVGTGGHAGLILRGLEGAGQLIGVDCDEEILEHAKQSLQEFGASVQLVHGHYEELPEILRGLGHTAVDGFLLDLGVSSLQFDRADRGFSFRQEGPIDMRMDLSSTQTALDLIRRSSEKDLERIIRNFGEEPRARRVAAVLKRTPLQRLRTTSDLARLVASVLPGRSKIHPATRTFQGLRIAVNKELERLERFLEIFPGLLSEGGRAVFIAYHSLEDRRIKQRLRTLKLGGSFKILTPKPIRPAEREIAENPR
ncbi:MAG: 16S rRNA (cytosine(1402)-N(4))-methyltransferase RsmH, partial [Deltaproteobacteria bacterium]|nr:16S rRNA (cytosine(1402)-N(4))-methyltransferase RsmH [Deltaproteobacteria bacterium]